MHELVFQRMKIKAHMLFEFVKSPFIGSLLSAPVIFGSPSGSPIINTWTSEIFQRVFRVRGMDKVAGCTVGM